MEIFPDAQIDLYQLDLSSLDSVRECAQSINKSVPKLNVLINNAGLWVIVQLYNKIVNAFNSYMVLN